MGKITVPRISRAANPLMKILSGHSYKNGEKVANSIHTRAQIPELEHVLELVVAQRAMAAESNQLIGSRSAELANSIADILDKNGALVKEIDEAKAVAIAAIKGHTFVESGANKKKRPPKKVSAAKHQERLEKARDALKRLENETNLVVDSDSVDSN